MDRFSVLMDNPALQVILPLVALVIPMAFLFAYSGMGLMVGVLQVKGARSGRSMYDRVARQIATCSLVLGWLLLIGTRVWIFFKSEGYVPQSFLGTVIELSWGIYGFAVIASTIHFAVWKPLSAHKFLHAALAFFSGINALFSLFGLMGALRLISAVSLPNANQLTVHDLFNFQIIPSPLVSATVLILPLGIAMAAPAAIVWLIIRRNRDDFGRDYYAVMTRFCARWGAAWWTILTLLFLGQAALEVMPYLQGVDALAEAGSQCPLAGVVPPQVLVFIKPSLEVLFPLLVTIILFCAGRADIPMRLKPWLILAFVFSFAGPYFLHELVTGFTFA